MDFTFYLGTDMPGWLSTIDVPLMVSHHRLKGYVKMPRALVKWRLDGGGFTQLSREGNYDSSPPKEYVRMVRRYDEEIGNMDMAAIQDWMCEDQMLKKTGKTVIEHQRLTIESYNELRYLAPEIPWLPVLQGYSREDYLEHLEMYARNGDYLTDLDMVGIGSVCRRQRTFEAEELIRELSGLGLNLHAFGFKAEGLYKVSRQLRSADSMAWCAGAWKRKVRLSDCKHKSATCCHCPTYALLWREAVVESAIRGRSYVTYIGEKSDAGNAAAAERRRTDNWFLSELDNLYRQQTAKN